MTLFRRNKRNATVSDILKLTARIDAQDAVIRTLTDKLKELEEEYGEEVVKTMQAERRYTEGVANILSYSYGNAASPAERKVE